MFFYLQMYATIPDDIYNAMLYHYDTREVSTEEFLHCLDILTHCETQEDADMLYIKPGRKFINRSSLFVAWMKRISRTTCKTEHFQEAMNVAKKFGRPSSLEISRRNFSFFLALLIKPFQTCLRYASKHGLFWQAVVVVLMALSLTLFPLETALAGHILILKAFCVEFFNNSRKHANGEISLDRMFMNTTNIVCGYLGSCLGGLEGLRHVFGFRRYNAYEAIYFGYGDLLVAVVGGTLTLDWVQERTSEIYDIPMSRGL